MTVGSPGFSGKPLTFVNFSVGNLLEAEMFWNVPVSALIIPAKPASGISAGGDPCLMLDLRLAIFVVGPPGITQYLTLSLTPPPVKGCFFLSCAVSLICCVVPSCHSLRCRTMPLSQSYSWHHLSWGEVSGWGTMNRWQLIHVLEFEGVGCFIGGTCDPTVVFLTLVIRPDQCVVLQLEPLLSRVLTLCRTQLGNTSKPHSPSLNREPS